MKAFLWCIAMAAMHGTTLQSADRLMIDLLAAAQAGDSERALNLVAAGANVNSKGKDGMTPLLAAVTKRHAATAQVLIDKGAQVDSRGERNETPLFTAARNGGWWTCCSRPVPMSMPKTLTAGRRCCVPRAGTMRQQPQC
jgi:hypothetical protein